MIFRPFSIELRAVLNWLHTLWYEVFGLLGLGDLAQGDHIFAE